MIDGAKVRLPGGVNVDLSTVEGVAKAEAELSAEQLAELEALMRSSGFKRDAGAFVPRDSYEMRRELGIVGPASTSSGETALDVEIGEKVFGAAGLASPYNANTTEKLYSQIKDQPVFTEAVSALNNYVANPTAANHADFLSRMAAVKTQFPNGNIMEVLFLVFRESIQETNEDKKYFLLKLQEFNTMAEKISDYLSHLVNESARLSEACEGQKYPEKVHINVETKAFDLSGLNANGDLSVSRQGSERLDRAGLNDRIKDVESMQETVRNKRQMASTAFQNFDQKANQLYNLMASVLKTVNEMRSGTVRNML
jgi:methyl-accepting chemotaxis protein